MDLLLKNSNSGDEVSTFQENGKSFIRKRSFRGKERLAEAALLQQNYKDYSLKTQAVCISRARNTPEFMEIEMPFVSGYSGQNIYVFLPPLEINQLSKNLIESVSHKFTMNSGYYSAKQVRKIIEDKLISIRHSLEGKRFFNLQSNFIDNVEANINGRVHQIEDNCPKAEIHGDMTFSNVIFDQHKNKIWLIDFLPVYLNSPLIDMAKLIQEYKYNWSARYLQKEVQILSKLIGSNCMKIIIGRTPLELLEYLGVFSILNLYRILPYVDDEITETWVTHALNRELQCDYKNSKHGYQYSSKMDMESRL